MGDISGKIIGLAAATAMALSLVSSAVATAGTAVPGDVFPITYLTPPANSVPGSQSGTMGPGYTYSPASTDGRYVLFASDSDNLATGINPDATGLFRRDLQTGDVVLVGRGDGADGPAVADYIYEYSISGDGNLVAFSTDTKVLPSDLDDNVDIYLRNVQAGTTTLLTGSITQDAYGSDLSADGNYLAFVTPQGISPGDSNGVPDVYRMKLSDGTSTIVSAISATTTAGDSSSSEPSISGNGAWVAFSSNSANLVAGFTDNNGLFGGDIYVRNLGDNTTRLVSARYNNGTASGNDDAEEPDIAGSPAALADVKIVYTDYGTNLADNGVTDPDSDASVYLRSMSTVASKLISRASGATGANADSRAHTPTISDDATKVVFSSDAENLGPPPDYYGVYMRNLATDTTSLVSAHNNYAVYGLISGSGSNATWTESGGATPDSDPDLASVFSRNLGTSELTLVSRPKGTEAVRAPGFQIYDESSRNLSETGRYYVFSTSSSRLPHGTNPYASQSYRRDLQTGDIELVSRASGADGAVAESSGEVSTSSDGQIVAFRASGPLDPADTNGTSDIYVRDLNTGTTTLASRADGPGGAVADESSENAVISGDGKRVAFVSEASNLGAPGTYPVIYVRDLASGKTLIASRATGEAGPLADGSAGSPAINFDGSKVVFTSYATNLSPDDPANNQSIYVRDLSGNQTELVSRAPGPGGASLPDYNYTPALSGDGSRVAFTSYDEEAVPATAPWPVGETQIVVRNLGDGTNILASSSSGGQPGDEASDNPSFSRDGNIIAFDTEATNIRTDLDNTNSETVVIRDLTTGTMAGPPSFGTSTFGYVGSRDPMISDSGDCVAFTAQGHNAISGVLGDLSSTYVMVRSGTCFDPLTIDPEIPVVPRLGSVKLTPAKFRVSPKPTAKIAGKKKKKKKKSPRGTKISFSLNTAATVTILVEQKVKGRKSGRKCIRITKKNRRKKACTKFVRRGVLTRKNVAAGATRVAFSGRIGKKALKPGAYRMTLQATSDGGVSNKPARSFRIVKR